MNLGNIRGEKLNRGQISDLLTMTASFNFVHTICYGKAVRGSNTVSTFGYHYNDQRWTVYLYLFQINEYLAISTFLNVDSLDIQELDGTLEEIMNDRDYDLLDKTETFWYDSQNRYVSYDACNLDRRMTKGREGRWVAL